MEIYTEPGDLESVRKSLEAAGVGVDGAESAMLAKQTVSLEPTTCARRCGWSSCSRTSTTCSA